MILKNQRVGVGYIGVSSDLDAEAHGRILEETSSLAPRLIFRRRCSLGAAISLEPRTRLRHHVDARETTLSIIDKLISRTLSMVDPDMKGITNKREP